MPYCVKGQSWCSGRKSSANHTSGLVFRKCKVNVLFRKNKVFKLYKINYRAVFRSPFLNYHFILNVYLKEENKSRSFLVFTAAWYHDIGTCRHPYIIMAAESKAGHNKFAAPIFTLPISCQICLGKVNYEAEFIRDLCVHWS